MLVTGSTIGDYRVLRHLGAGGMGDVYLVENIHINTQYALKTIKAGTAMTDAVIAQFRLEAQVMAALEHPSIVKVHHAGADASLGVYYLVMDYVEGVDGCVSLEDQIAHGERLPEERVLAIARQLSDAIRYAHSHPSGVIIHRDLKPANILLDRDGNVLISDFGLATIGGGVRAHSDSSPGAQSGNVVGTFDYMSPEQQEGRQALPQSDIYSLGLILYRLLTGIQAKGRWPLPSECGVSHEWDVIIESALSPELTDRYGSAVDLIADLDTTEQRAAQKQYTSGARSHITGQGERIASVIASESKRSRRALWVLILVLLAAGGISAAVLLSSRYKAYRIYKDVQVALDGKAWDETDRLLTMMLQHDRNSDRYKTAGDVFFDHKQYALAYKYYKVHRPSDYRFALAAFCADDLETAATEAVRALRRDASARGTTIGHTGYTKHEEGVLKWVIGKSLYLVEKDIPGAFDKCQEALALLDDGDLKTSIASIVQSMQETSKKMEGLYSAAWDEFRKKQFADAYEKFNDVYRGTTGSSRRLRARFAMGHCRRGQGDNIAAKNIFLEIEPKINWSKAGADSYVQICVSIAAGFREEDNCREAIKYARKAYDKSPTNGSVSDKLAWYLVTAQDKSLRRPEEALEIAKETVRSSEKESPYYYSTLAACYASVNDFHNAVKVQRKAVRLAQEENVAGKYQEHLNGYLKEKIPWDEESQSVGYAKEAWELSLKRNDRSLEKMKKYAPKQWKSAMTEISTAEMSKYEAEQIEGYRKATEFLRGAAEEIKKPSFIRFETGSSNAAVYRCIDRRKGEYVYLGKVGTVIQLSPFERHTLEIREPKTVWHRMHINVDRPNCDYGKRVVRLEGRPDGGDKNATSWKVLTKRLVKNIYVNGDETFSDKETGSMWVYNPTVWGKKQWDIAREFCHGLSYAGYSNWTLPTQEDLKNLVQQRSILPIYNYKDSMDASKIRCYWTSETPWAKSHAFVITASLKNYYSYPKSDKYGVFPKRKDDGGPSEIPSKNEQSKSANIRSIARANTDEGIPKSVRYTQVKPASVRAISEGTYQGKTQYTKYAIDGKKDTSWASQWSMPAWLEVDLGTIKQVGKVKVMWGRGSHNQYYTIATSKDKRKWNTAVSARWSKTDAVKYSGHDKGNYRGNSKATWETLSFPATDARYVPNQNNENTSSIFSHFSGNFT